MPFNGICRVYWSLHGNPCPQCLTGYNDSNFRLLIYILMFNVIYYVERDIVLLNMILCVGYDIDLLIVIFEC